MLKNKLLFIMTTTLFVGCSSVQEKACREEADVAETVMDARLKQSNIANATLLLAGNNTELRERLRPIIDDAYEYDRGGLSTFDATKKRFKEKYYQQCINRQDK
ncbi:hypothetical protein F975_00838 [Acinetobacter sp. ANC 3789]|uniref:hypothetical protein n=1 Tax=Acinetobacter sp. ANC 3789 TaxID=1217714 RepID=UPI0002CFC705|nr:hypothetical protein [Acinetobacter sp. ANC 3789]ENU80980.1 hypothetical protein F975_00838 [Acinetobacter sp. ANC 3789]